MGGHEPMANAQITIALTPQERRSLFRIAESECRDPGEQLRFLLRREAQQRGLLSTGLNEKAVSGDKPTRHDQISNPRQV
jgi:hypothetical protein